MHIFRCGRGQTNGVALQESEVEYRANDMWEGHIGI